MTPPAEMRAALRAGRQAARAKQPSNNPYATGATPRERVLSVMWRQGYQEGNSIKAE